MMIKWTSEDLYKVKTTLSYQVIKVSSVFTRLYVDKTFICSVSNDSPVSGFKGTDWLYVRSQSCMISY